MDVSKDCLDYVAYMFWFCHGHHKKDNDTKDDDKDSMDDEKNNFDDTVIWRA